MAVVQTVKEEVTFKIELNKKELGTIVSALRNDHDNIRKLAERIEITDILDSVPEAHLYHSLRRALRGAN